MQLLMRLRINALIQKYWPTSFFAKNHHRQSVDINVDKA